MSEKAIIETQEKTLSGWEWHWPFPSPSCALIDIFSFIEMNYFNQINALFSVLFWLLLWSGQWRNCKLIMPVQEPACCLGIRQINMLVHMCKIVHFQWVVGFCSLETDTEVNHSYFSCCLAAQTCQFEININIKPSYWSHVWCKSYRVCITFGPISEGSRGLKSSNNEPHFTGWWNDDAFMRYETGSFTFTHHVTHLKQLH